MKTFPEFASVVDTDSPGQEAVLEELERVLSGQEFRTSIRMCRFLRYVVEEALQGNYAGLKETCIGVAVFDREPTYDPKTDPVVRSEARRLRQKLASHYAGGAPDGHVRILLPKGGYTPTFVFAFAVEPPSEDLPEGFNPVNLAPLLPREAMQTGPPIAGRGRWNRKILIAFLFVICIVGAPILFWQLGHNTAFSTNVVPEKITPLTAFPGFAFSPSISPDGTRIAFVSKGADQHLGIYVMQFGGKPLEVTPGDGDYSNPAWSPDGHVLAYLHLNRGRIEVLTNNFPGGREQLRYVVRGSLNLYMDPTNSYARIGPVWTADGQGLITAEAVAGAGSIALQLHNLAGGIERQLTSPSGTDFDLTPSPSRDGKWLAYTRVTSNSSSDLYVLSLGGGGEQRLTDEHADIRGLSWLPGDFVLFSSNRTGAYILWMVSVKSGSPAPLLSMGESALQPSVSADGTKIVYVDYTSTENVYRLPLTRQAAREPSVLFESSRQSNSAQYSPDGKLIAFASDRSGNWELWVGNADGSSQQQVTQLSSQALGTARWSPDGQSIVFDARSQGRSSIFIISADGSGLRRLNPQDRFDEKLPGWSRDGHWIYYLCNRNGRFELWRTPLSGGPPSPIFDGHAGDLQASFHHPWLYFEDGSSRGMFQIPAVGGTSKPVPGLESIRAERVWFVAPGGIYFVDQDRLGEGLQFWDETTHKVTQVVQLQAAPMTDSPSLSISPDGDYVIYTHQDESRSNLVMLKLPRP